MSLTSSTRIKTILGIPAGITFHDTAVGYAVDAANAYVLRKLGQSSLAVQTSMEWPEIYGGGQVAFLLKHSPVVGIVALTNGSSLLTTDDYRIDNTIGEVRLKGQTTYWSTDRDGVQIMYGWGYDSTTLPGELYKAADLIAVDGFNRGSRSGKASESEGGYSYRISDDLIPAAARVILANYVDIHHT